MSSISLSDLSLSQVSNLLQSYGSSLQGDSREAVQGLLEALEQGLRGNLDNAYHLSAIDPGIGKTLSVTTFLRVWKEQGFDPSSSVLIGLSRLQEIEVYLKDAGLDREDVAILTRSEQHNDLGVPPDRHGSARIMFTTQQMIEKRTRGQTFSETIEFHYQGRARTLRIWDESLIAAEQLVLRADDLGRLPAALRRQAPEYAANVQTLAVKLWGPAKGEHVLVPEHFADPPQAAKSAKDAELREIVETLARMAGQEVATIDKRSGDTHLVGASAPLPSDFPPVIILDASGRVRSTYSIWEEAGGPLRRLPSAANDYARLRVHLWERPVGREALRKPGAIEDIVKVLAELITDDEGSEWLIVSYKGEGRDEASPVEAMLRLILKPNLQTHVNFLTWGMHHGTNAFASCDRIVLIGQLHYGTLGYRALAAACGATISDDTSEVEQQLKAGELRHNMLQALTRAQVRKSVNGTAGSCTAYVIASPNMGAADMLPEVFPGCTIEPWSPNVDAVGGQAGELIALLKNGMERKLGQIAKKDLAKELNIKPPNISRLLKHPDVRMYIERQHIWNDRTALVLPRGFDPYPGGGFTFDELDELD